MDRGKSGGYVPEIVGILYIHLHKVSACTVGEEQRRPILISCGVAVYGKGIGLLCIRIEDVGREVTVNIQTTIAASGQPPHGRCRIGCCRIPAADGNGFTGKCSCIRSAQSAHHIVVRYSKGRNRLGKILLPEDTGAVTDKHGAMGRTVDGCQKRRTACRCCIRSHWRA